MVAALGGCDVGEPEHQPIDAPPLQAPKLFVTAELQADGTPEDPVEITSGGSVLVQPSTSLRLRFDRYLLPASIVRQAVCLRSSLDDVSSFTQCGGGELLHPAYDPVRREVVLRQEGGARLALDTTYKLTVFAATIEGSCTGEDPASCGVLAFDRAPLEQPVTFTFKTVAADPGNVPDEAPPPAAFCDPDPANQLYGVKTILGSCAYPSCHSPTTNGPGAAAGLDLSLGDPFALGATAINRVAHQTQTGERADDPEETPARFGRAMPIIDAFDPGVTGSPGNSYLLYKLLVHPNLEDDIRASEEELARLRASVVVGLPMPPTDPGKNPSVSSAELLTLSNWIARGAPTPSCP